MARPVNADAAATRQRILDSALALFADRGIGGASIRRIADASGVSLAMVHHYYGSKDDLYAACVESMYAELQSMLPALERAISDTRDPTALIGRAIRHGFRFARAHQVHLRLLMRSVVSAGELAPEHRDQVQLPFLEQIPRALATLLDRPAASMRLPLQSIQSLVVRYALSSPRELATFTGIDEPDAAARAIEDHLVATALAVLGVGAAIDQES